MLGELDGSAETSPTCATAPHDGANIQPAANATPHSASRTSQHPVGTAVLRCGEVVAFNMICVASGVRSPARHFRLISAQPLGGWVDHGLQPAVQGRFR